MGKNEKLRERLGKVHDEIKEICKEVGWEEPKIQRVESAARESFDEVAPSIEEGVANLLAQSSACLEFLRPAQE